MSGFVKLHRKMVDWEWYSDINCKTVFIHLLLKADHKERNWRGKKLPVGSHVTSLEILADECNLTVRQVRTALNKLKTTNEVTHASSRLGSVISITNYKKYHNSDKERDFEKSLKSHSNDIEMSTIKEVKNNKEYKNKINTKKISFDSYLEKMGFTEDQLLDEIMERDSKRDYTDREKLERSLKAVKNYSASKNILYVDYMATIRNFYDRDFQKSKPKPKFQITYTNQPNNT